MDQVEKLCDAIALISRGKLVLDGGMREVKGRYPRNRVQMQFEGDDAFFGIRVWRRQRTTAAWRRSSWRAAAPDAQPLLAAALAPGRASAGLR